MNDASRLRLQILEEEAREANHRILLVDRQVRIRTLDPQSEALKIDPQSLPDFTVDVPKLIRSGLVFCGLEPIGFDEFDEDETFDYEGGIYNEEELKIWAWGLDVLVVSTNGILTEKGFSQLWGTARTIALDKGGLADTARDRFVYEDADRCQNNQYRDLLYAFLGRASGPK